MGSSVTPRARAFLGIPYAEPPVGSRRWKAPRPVQPWDADGMALNATMPPPGCPQQCRLPPYSCPAHTSEDCLYLSVWAPSALPPDGSLLPVAVFIHGGQFTSGFGGAPSTVYDASDLVANTAVIWVGINYRLGALGFLYTSDNGINGNYGLMDQEAALRWVQAHIRSFGGDPSRVTLVGQSAGALSVAAHLSRPDTHGLYARAILHSAPLSLPFRDRESQRHKLAVKVARGAGCLRRVGNKRMPEGQEPPVDWKATEKCLRRLSADAIVEAQGSVTAGLSSMLTDFLHAGMPFTPTIGTAYLPVAPLTALREQPQLVADVPILLGATSGEADLFVYGPSGVFKEPVDEFMYSLGVGFVLGFDRQGAIQQHYPQIQEHQKADLRPHISRLLTDGLFVCPKRAVANVLASAREKGSRTSHVYKYVYDHAFSFGRQAWGEGYPACWASSCHGTDLLSLFHVDVGLIGATYSKEEHELSRALQTYWGGFIHHGVPGGNGSAFAVDFTSSGVAVDAAGGTTNDGGLSDRQASVLSAVKKWVPFTTHKRRAVRLAAKGAGRGVGTVHASSVGRKKDDHFLDDFRGHVCEQVWDRHGYSFGV